MTSKLSNVPKVISAFAGEEPAATTANTAKPHIHPRDDKAFMILTFLIHQYTVRLPTTGETQD